MTDDKSSPSPENQNGGAMSEYPDLRTLREAKGLSLQDIFERTRISVANLDAIESGQYHLLPAPVYVRTFIKTYAQMIGADSQILLNAYEQYLASLNESVRQKKDTGKGRRKTGEPSYNWMIWLLSATMTIIVIVLIGSFHDQPNPDISQVQPSASVQKTPDGNPAGTNLPAILKPPPASPDRVETAQASNNQAPPRSTEITRAGTGLKTDSNLQPQTQEQATGKKYHLTAEAREEVWVRIREDDNKPEQMLMKAGDKFERSASASFTIDIGNAGGIDIRLQGKSIGSIGKRGDVVHLRLP